MSIFLHIILINFLLIWMIFEYFKNKITVLFMVLAWSIVIYGLVPISLNLSYDEIANLRFTTNPNALNSSITAFLVLLFFLSLYIGSSFAKNIKYKISIENNEILSVKIGFYLLCIGLICLIFYIYSYGGLSYFLQNMSSIRSGTADVKNYFAAFINIFTKYISLSFLILYAVFLKQKNKSINFLLLFYFSLFFSLVSLYFSAGRENGIAFLISTIVVYLVVKKKIPKIYAIFAASLAFFYIVFGKIFLFALNNENFDAATFVDDQFLDVISNSYNMVMSEFTHQYLSLLNFLNNNYDYRFFGDYIYWLLKPLKLMGIDIPDSISYYNTYIIYGVWDSEIPPGAVAFGYISLGSAGVALHGLILGFIFKSIDRIFRVSEFESSILIGFYAMLVTSFTYLLSNSDPALFVQGRISQFVFFFFLLVFLRAKFKKG